MKKSPYSLISLLLLTIYCAAGVSYALDAPHNPAGNVDCDLCHYPTNIIPPDWATLPTPTGSTPLNELCISCHHTNSTQIANPKFEDVTTHSSYETDPTATGANSYLMECRTCHNPHWQDQMRALPADGTLDFGTTSGITSSLLTDVTKSWAIDQFKDALLIPNTAYIAYAYRIAGNTANTLTIVGSMKTMAPYTGVGKPYRIKYGKMIKKSIATPNSGARAVTFLNNQGPSSFATSSVLVNGVCQVCHTQTGSYTNTGTLEGPGHPSLKTGTNCTVCHQHSSGFRANCGSCHGNPPVGGSSGGPDGLANNEGGTGSLSPGEHKKHAVSLGYACNTCHTGGMPASTVYDKKLQLGFSIAGGAYTSGSYDGRTALSNGYTYTRGNPGTTITTGGTQVCSNVYCHGNYSGSGWNVSPIWGGTALCGSCHGASNTAPPGSGKHSPHASPEHYGFKCTLCHSDVIGGTSPDAYTITDNSKHVNGYVDYKFDPADPRVAGGTYSIATGSAAPTNGTIPRAYGRCSTIYCHSNVQPEGGVGLPSSYSTPSWASNGAAACGSCHAGGHGNLITTGSHSTHLAYTFTLSDYYKNAGVACVICHSWYPSQSLGCSGCHSFYTAPEHGKHADHKVDMAFDPAFNTNGSATYNGTPAPGDGYNSCSNTYCHGDGTSVVTGTLSTNTSSVWGDSGTLACNSCHGYPPNYANGAPKANTHAEHSGSSCAVCHYGTTTDGTTITSKVKHVNKQYDLVSNAAISFKYTFSASGGSCSNGYCHSTGQGVSNPMQPATFSTATWGNPASGACGACHDLGSHTGGWGTPLSSGSHSAHFRYDYSFGTSPSNCQVCHYTAGGSCNLCHPDGSNYSDRNAYSRNAVNHVDNRIDVDFLAAITGSTAAYSGDRIPGTAFGSCSMVYCHSDGTSRATGVIPANTSPVWGVEGTLACNACHGFPPSYPSGSPKVNSHASHSSYTCAQCHSTTTADGTTITNYENHVDQSYDVTPRAGKYFAYVNGACSQISCHGNTGAQWGSPATYDCVDLDGDGICADDNCPTMANPGQEDANGNGIGDVCDAWLSVSAGQWHSLARKADGSQWAWGYGESGSLGIGVQESRLTPAQSGPDTNWTSSAGGQFHTLALKSDNTLWAWGMNSYGQLGTGNTSVSLSPVKAGSDSNWLAVKAGASHTLAIKTDGTLWTWGSNYYGQLGLGDLSITRKLSPVKVGTDTGWTHIAAGEGFNLAIKSGTLWAWGQNSAGQLGDGFTTDRSAPVQIGSATDWVMVAAGATHGLALKSNGELWAWGSNSSGQLGDGTTVQKLTPVRIGTDADWTSIACGNWHSLALKANKTIWSWGGNYNGQLGDNTTENNKNTRQVGSDSTWISIAAGIAHSLAVRSDGSLWTWGSNSDGQIGDGTKTDRLSPALVN